MKYIKKLLLAFFLLTGSTALMASNFSCKDIIVATELILSAANSGKPSSDSDKTYILNVFESANKSTASFLMSLEERIKKGDSDAELFLSTLQKKGLGTTIKVSELSYMSMRYIFLNKERFDNLRFTFDQCIGYGLSAYALS
tara:strand:+ start:1316 stop:1741 length:426 start_codon:yes stop_codon:yes gene_type:complete